MLLPKDATFRGSHGHSIALSNSLSHVMQVAHEFIATHTRGGGLNSVCNLSLYLEDNGDFQWRRKVTGLPFCVKRYFLRLRGVINIPQIEDGSWK